MGKEENIVVFQDTQQQYTSNPKLVSSIEASRAAQKMIPETEKIQADTSRLESKAKIVVSEKRTLEAASAYAGKKVCVLNFASASYPGGGVAHGAPAQEESLCRISTLYPCISSDEMRKAFYAPHRAAGNPIHNGDLIYTPSVTVFKSDSAAPVLLPEEEWYQVDVITCAAPNLRERARNFVPTKAGDQFFNDTDLKNAITDRTRKILAAAAAHERDVLVLGAFGCGAYRNPPEVVARAMKKAIEEYMNAFETIEFAVYCTVRDRKNFEIFRRIFG